MKPPICKKILADIPGSETFNLIPHLLRLGPSFGRSSVTHTQTDSRIIYNRSPRVVSFVASLPKCRAFQKNLSIYLVPVFPKSSLPIKPRDFVPALKATHEARFSPLPGVVGFRRTFMYTSLASLRGHQPHSAAQPIIPAIQHTGGQIPAEIMP